MSRWSGPAGRLSSSMLTCSAVEGAGWVEEYAAHVGTGVVVRRGETHRVTGAHGSARRIRETRHVLRPRLVQHRVRKHEAPGRIRGEERSTARVGHVQGNAAAVQVT